MLTPKDHAEVFIHSFVTGLVHAGYAVLIIDNRKLTELSAKLAAAMDERGVLAKEE